MAKVNTRGRPKKSIAPVANATKKRGRPAAKVQTRTEHAVAEAQETAAVMTPRKRGRPSIAASEAQAAEETPKKSRGRPRKEDMAKAEEPAIAPKKRPGRPRQVEAVARVNPATPKRPGRPPKNATSVNLNRVANVASSRAGNRTSPRVAKRTSPRSKQPAVQPTSATPIKSRGRAKLRTPVVSAQKITTQPAKKRGRPKGTGKGPLLKRTHSRKPIKTTSISRAAVAKPTITRKKRGITTLDVPDKFVAQLKQYLQELQAGALPTPGNQDDGAEIEDQVEPDADAGAEDDDIIVDVVVQENDIMITSANDNSNELEDDSDELEDKSDEFEGNSDELGDDSEQLQRTEHEEAREEDLDAGETHIHEHLDNETNPIVENNVDFEPTEIVTEVETSFQQHVEFDETRLEDIFNDAPMEGDMQRLEKDLSELPDAGDDHAMGVFKHAHEPKLSIGAIFSPV